MSHIFRLGTQGSTNTASDWANSVAQPYNQDNIDSIDDPNGASAQKEITSIPSPFARIDLVKRAFGYIANHKDHNGKIDLDGDTIYHKMVSDALDVGEIFFNIDKYEGLIEIITWNPGQGIQDLLNSSVEGHRILANSLQTYLKLDKGYNFSKLQNIYLLNYIHGPEAMNIIGATSPATFFFSSANNLSYVGERVTFGQDKPFDNEYQPLYKRDRDYIKSWFYLKYVAMPQTFAQDFPEVNDYLTATFNAITDMQFRQELLQPGDVLKNAQPLAITATSNVEVIGMPLLKKSISYKVGTSDFEINATVNVDQKPLVLPVEPGNKYSQFHYITAKWGSTNHAAYHDPRGLSKRTLPQDGTHYPYLTVDDFLEETILRVNHPLNHKQYFDGNFSSNGQSTDYTYLLPVKNLFFDYFTIDDLKNGLTDGTRMIEMNSVGTGVKVIIRIPIKGNGNVKHIEYSRIYYAPGTDTALDKNEGVIADVDFTGYVMPARVFAQENEAYYSIGLVSTFNCNYAFTFRQGGKSFVADSQCRNISVPQTVKTLTYTLERHNFDSIVMSDGAGHQGLLVPAFRKQLETETFSFAVDLGTSNTHIEYITQRNQTPKALEYGVSQDSPISRMFIHEEMLGGTTINHLQEEEAAMEYDAMPNLLGGKSLFKFPTRTVLNHKSGVDWGQRLKPFELINLPFPFNKKKDRAYNQSEMDLKWGSGKDSDRMMASYIECLTVIMRNMVVMNDGSLSKTKITWFYPISMTPRRINNMRTEWDNMYKKYLNPQGSTTNMTESIAPVRYFYQSLPTARNLVNIDIGGGTTDIAFSDNGELQFVTSFRFASNDLFKCDLGKRNRNGIIDYYRPQFDKILGNLKDQELHDILQGIQNSDNVASFLFTLPENPSTATLERSSIDFISKLSQDDDFKIVFIVFYGAIIYHIAEILKKKRLPMPRHITLSGNGSRVLRIITSSEDIMSKFTRTIFQLLGVEGSDGTLDVLGLAASDNPKQSTCKGALISNAPVNDDSNKIVVMRSDGYRFITNQDLLSGIDSAYEDRATDAVVNCLKFILEDLNKAFNFDDNFGLKQPSLNLAKSWTDKAHQSDIKNFIDRGLQKSKADTPGSDTISETLFFYPFKGIIDDLSANIYNQLGGEK